MDKLAILGVVRHILTFGGGFAVAYGLADQSMVSVAVGALMTLIGIGWSIYDKKALAA